MNWQEDLLNLVEAEVAFLIPYLLILKQIVFNWWWLLLPFIFWKPFIYLWLWWRGELWGNKQKNILLEIRIPKNNPKPVRAMELVLSGMWQVWAEANWIEKWWDGQGLLQYSLEVAAIDGIPHFLIRCNSSTRTIIETHIYSQFPEAEIFEVEDYTKKVPQDIPNKDWDMWSTDFKMIQKNCYPIRTYRDFETEKEVTEEQKIDPISSLLEGMALLKKGEQMWLQINITPIQKEVSWVEEGKKEINKLLQRKEAPPKTSIWQDIINILMTGAPAGKEESKDSVLPPEMKLSPGEKDIVSGIERKISKVGFETYIRYIYLAKRDVMFKPNLRLPMSYFTNFLNANSNGLVPDGKTIPKVRKKWYDPIWFPQRRLYLKKRTSFRKYVERIPYFFPQSGGTFVLNAEEIASIYHFPSRVLTPSSLIPRVEAKKGEAPYELPVED